MEVMGHKTGDDWLDWLGGVIGVCLGVVVVLLAVFTFAFVVVLAVLAALRVFGLV